MKNQNTFEIQILKDQFNDEIGLGRKRSEITGGEPSYGDTLTVEEEAILDELGLGRDVLSSNIVEENSVDTVAQQ